MKSPIVWFCLALVLPFVAAGCAKDANGNFDVSPTAKPYIDALAPLAWDASCAYAERQFGKLKHPSLAAVVAMGTVSATCDGPAPTDMTSAKATLGVALKAFAGELAAGH